MKSYLLVCVIALVAFPCRAQDKSTFPTNDEIQLVLTQTDRAMAQYKPLIDQEESELGKKGAEAVAKDRQVVEALETALDVLKKNPQGFNSAAGFMVVEWLDDATRNALLCSQTAMSDAVVLATAGKMEAANPLMRLSQSCMDVSTLIYTISENASALYTRYAKSEQDLAEYAYNTLQKCGDALKKVAPPQK